MKKPNRDQLAQIAFAQKHGGTNAAMAVDFLVKCANAHPQDSGMRSAFTAAYEELNFWIKRSVQNHSPSEN